MAKTPTARRVLSDLNDMLADEVAGCRSAQEAFERDDDWPRADAARQYLPGLLLARKLLAAVAADHGFVVGGRLMPLAGRDPDRPSQSVRRRSAPNPGPDV